MRILPISNTNIYNKHSYCAKPSFTAHPYFNQDICTASCYFRRGAVLLSCAKGYESIEKTFYKIFKQNVNTQKNMLIVGIGSSQEPFSYLASIKGIIKNNALKNNLDLYTVDLQSRPEHIKLKQQAFCNLNEYQIFPRFAASSFVKDTAENWLEIKHDESELSFTGRFFDLMPDNYEKCSELIKNGHSFTSALNILKEEKKQENMKWRVNDEIFDFLEKTYNNSQKSQWNIGIQDVIKIYSNEKFDIISANNVLTYILVDREVEQTVRNIERILKKGGYFITDPYEDTYHVKKLDKYKNIKKIDAGIYQKI